MYEELGSYVLTCEGNYIIMRKRENAHLFNSKERPEPSSLGIKMGSKKEEFAVYQDYLDEDTFYIVEQGLEKRCALLGEDIYVMTKSAIVAKLKKKKG